MHLGFQGRAGKIKVKYDGARRAKNKLKWDVRPGRDVPFFFSFLEGESGG